MRSVSAVALALFGTAQAGLAQAPVVFPDVVVNAATYARYPGQRWVAQGSLVAIFGKNLASTTAWADSFPLPTTLAGTSVYFTKMPAPLLYVSPSQINVQVPSGGSSGVLEPVIVTTRFGSSEPVYVVRDGSDLGIFTLDGSGCGRGAVFNVAPDGTFSANGPMNSLEPGGIIAVYGTGIATGGLNPPAMDGEPAPADPPAQFRDRFWPISASMAGAHPLYTGINAFVIWAGRAPGFAGLDQYNLRIPDNMPEGCSIPLWLIHPTWSATQTVPVSVHRGGGQCVDPPEQSIGILRWKKTVVSAPTPTITEELLIEFAAAPGKQAPGAPLSLNWVCRCTCKRARLAPVSRAGR